MFPGQCKNNNDFDECHNMHNPINQNEISIRIGGSILSFPGSKRKYFQAQAEMSSEKWRSMHWRSPVSSLLYRITRPLYRALH